MTTVRHCAEQLAAAVTQSENAVSRGLLERLEVFQFQARTVVGELVRIADKADAEPAAEPAAPEPFLDPDVSEDEIDEDPAEEPHILSAPGGVLYSDGSVVEADGDRYSTLPADPEPEQG